MSEIHYNPFDPAVRANPYPIYERLREEDPLHRIEGLGIVAISRHEDVLAALKDPRSFSSTALRDLFNNGAANVGEDDGQIDGETLIGTDPPVHTRLRKIVNRAFTPSRIARLEPRIRQITRELVAQFEDCDECELIYDLATPLPLTVIIEIFGVDASRREDFKRWSDDLLLAVTGRPTPEQAVRIEQSDDELGEWIDETVALRVANPGDDLISALVAAESSEEVMTGEEIGNLIVLLLIAGNETTANLIGNSVVALLDNPEQLALLRARPELMPGAIEELLRFTSPVQLSLRRAMRDVELPSGKIRQGEMCATLFASANRDPRRFDEPAKLDLRRDAHGHLAFGFGTHFCVGANLARLEASVALEALLARPGSMELVNESLEYTESLLVRGPRYVHLRFDR